jgi:hypothetical protein
MLIAGVLITMAFVMMPFSVFGLKSRLEAIEARMDEIQGEIRALVLRLPEPGRVAAYEAETFGRAAQKPPPPASPRPPIPPAAWTPDGAPRRPIGAGVPSADRPRMEPRIDRFR